MSPFQGFTKTIVAPSFAWLNPLSSPAVALAASGIVALAWAFQQQGWSFCIPGVVLAVRKIASLRWNDVAALARQAGILAQEGTGCLMGLSIRLAPR